MTFLKMLILISDELYTIKIYIYISYRYSVKLKLIRLYLQCS